MCLYFFGSTSKTNSDFLIVNSKELRDHDYRGNMEKMTFTQRRETNTGENGIVNMFLYFILLL